ncbi:hypothetical protein [Sorangium sp. So ce1097]|uniref:hypothetical protein n=1 Tax=Sorangium sp. So ce1097 TaxID=3133330 RepID=UPI003F5DD244
MATYDAPDSSDIDLVQSNTVVGLINLLVGDVTALLGVNIIDDVKLVDVADVLNNSEVGILNNVLNNVLVKLQILNIQNVLKDVDVANGLKVGDILSDNDIDLKDVVDVKIEDNKLLVFYK